MADLCRAHIVNQAFAGVSGQWVVQRADVDNFYGAHFESEFVKLQSRSTIDAAICIFDRALAKKFGPTILLNGSPVEFYHPKASSKTPSNHTRIEFQTDYSRVDLALKLNPEDVMHSDEQAWELHLEKDLRLPALVSLLKAAHLTLFRMQGYRYALSDGGRFLGKSILGDFYSSCKHSNKEVVLQNAGSWFARFSNLVRPVTSSNPILRGTAEDNRFLICQNNAGAFWAFVVFIRTSEALHAVVTPAFEAKEGRSKFENFLADDGGELLVRVARFNEKRFEVGNQLTSHSWPKSGFTG